MDVPRVPGLAADIAHNAAVLQKAEEGSEDAQQALAAIRAASHDLELAATPAADWLHTMWSGFGTIAAMGCLVEFDALRAIPSESSIAYGDLAARIGMKQDVLERLCRYTATAGFLREEEPGRVQHSPSSKLAAEFSRVLSFQLGQLLPPLFRVHEALRYDPAAEDLDTSALALDKRRPDGTCPTFWEWLDENPEYRECFAQLMQLGAKNSRTNTVAQAFDWGSLGPGSTVVDVGGGRGHMMLELADKFPSLRYIVQDKGGVVNSQAHQNGGATVEFMAHDFLEPQPVQAADVYFFSRIFHDWPDKWCKKILSATVSAMKPGSKLIIQDEVLAEPGGRLNYSEWSARTTDMAMQMVFNSKERSLSQWMELVCGTEPRLRFEGACTPKGSELTALVFAFAES